MPDSAFPSGETRFHLPPPGSGIREESLLPSPVTYCNPGELVSKSSLGSFSILALIDFCNICYITSRPPADKDNTTQRSQLLETSNSFPAPSIFPDPWHFPPLFPH
jgi:hypothetical protein